MVRSELFSGFHGYLPPFPLQNRKKPGAVLQAFSLSWVLSPENISHGLRQPVRLLRRVEGGKADPDRAGVQRPGGAVGQRRAMQPRPHRDPPPRQRFAHGLHVPPRHPLGPDSRDGRTPLPRAAGADSPPSGRSGHVHGAKWPVSPVGGESECPPAGLRSPAYCGSRPLCGPAGSPASPD